MMTRECKETARRIRRRLAPLLLLAVAGGAAAAEVVPGRVWSPDRGTFVPQARVVDAVARARFVLLGETHTQARHHVLQARMIRAAARDGHRPALVLEMVRADQQDAIDAWRRAGADPAAFGEAVAWEQRGWPDWARYRPVIEAAVALDLPIYGGAPPEALFASVARGGLAALAPEHRARLGLDAPLPRPAQRRLERTLVRAHCGLSGHASLDPMLALQRLRDAVMATRLRSTAATGGGVLIAGHGHVRRDYGVPRYLEPHRADASVLSIAFLAAGGDATLADHRARAGGRLAFDYVWFTRGQPQLHECPERGASAANAEGG